MAETKISALPAAGLLDGSESVPIVQLGTTVKTTTQDIADLAAGGGGFDNPMTASGDMIVASDSSGTPARLPIVSYAGYVLTVVSDPPDFIPTPTWVAPTYPPQHSDYLDSTGVTETLPATASGDLNLYRAWFQWQDRFLLELDPDVTLYLASGGGETGGYFNVRYTVTWPAPISAGSILQCALVLVSGFSGPGVPLPQPPISISDTRICYGGLTSGQEVTSAGGTVWLNPADGLSFFISNGDPANDINITIQIWIDKLGISAG